ncbi:MAG: thioredoxin family protein [Ferruginibacter sp.]
MKLIVLLLLFFFNSSLPGWLTNFNEAKKAASAKHELILLNFSGSDWCGPCIRLRKEIFESKEFVDFSTPNLVLVNADFPRSNKNKLSIEQVKLNESLADIYNSNGKFPLTLLLDENGRVIKEWDGFPDISPDKYVALLKQLCDANK